MLGQFKTPPLRGVADTAPHGHGGSLSTLSSVVKNYSLGGLAPTDTRAVGVTEPWVLEFTSNHIAELVPFLEALSAAPAP
jgi:cytochrome c peroxidase